MHMQGNHHVVSLALRGSGEARGCSVEEQSLGGWTQHQAGLHHDQGIPVTFS